MLVEGVECTNATEEKFEHDLQSMLFVPCFTVVCVMEKRFQAQEGCCDEPVPFRGFGWDGTDRACG